MEDNSVDRSPESLHPTASGRILNTETPLTEELPPDLQVALARYLGVDSIPTLDAWTRALRTVIGDGPITVEALCLTSEDTPHRGVMDGDTYHFACFYDAVILAAIADQPVDIRTKSPDGVEITARAQESDVLDVDSPEAVFSFGIDRHVDPPTGDDPSMAVGYESICPYVKAFPTAEDYYSWASTVPAPTVALPLAGATGLAVALGSDPDH